MNCPIDNTPLAISERQGIEIDYCPTCRGVWLDRGELDKLIERNSQFNASRGFADDDEDNFSNPQRAQPGAPYPPQQLPYQQQPQPPYPPQQPARGGGPDIAGVALDLIQKGLNSRRNSGHSSGYDGRKKKKGGLLGELFDF